MSDMKPLAWTRQVVSDESRHKGWLNVCVNVLHRGDICGVRQATGIAAINWDGLIAEKVSLQ